MTMGTRGKDLTWLALFASTGTLICRALPVGGGEFRSAWDGCGEPVGRRSGRRES